MNVMYGSSFSRKCRRIFLPLVILLVVAAAAPAYAQQDVGTILGVVTDPAGNLVSNAKVHVTNDSTGISQDMISNSSGYFETQPIAPGLYTLTVTMPGFATTTVQHIVVDAAAHVSSNVQLQIGSVETSV